MRNHSYENEFDLHENETACRTHFHIRGTRELRNGLLTPLLFLTGRKMQGISKICSLYLKDFCYIGVVYHIFCYSWPWGEEYLSNLLYSSTVLWKIQPTVYKDREHVSGEFTSFPASASARGAAKNPSGSRDSFLSDKRFCSNTRDVTNCSAIRFYRNLR